MRLSMNILADWLKKYDPKASIRSGGRVIQNVRPFSDEHTIRPNNVYVGRLSAEDSGAVMCINRNDFLFLNTEDENQVINDIMDAFDFYNAWADEQYGRLGETTLKDILLESRNVLDSYLMVADPAYYVIESSEPAQIPGQDPVLVHVSEYHIMDFEDIIKIEKVPHTRMRDRSSYRYEGLGFIHHPSVRNLFPGGQHAGWLIQAADEITPGMMDIQDELGDMIEAWINTNTDYKNHLNREAVFYDILSGQMVDRNKLRAGLMLSGVSENDEKILYCIEPPGNISGFTLKERVDELSSSAHTLVQDSLLICIFFGNENKRVLFEKDLGKMIKSTGAVCAASPVFFDLMTLSEQLEHAKAAIEFKADLKAPDTIMYFEKAVLYQSAKILKTHTGSWLMHPAVGKLRSYDEKNKTQLLETLKIYIECERNYAETARRMNIHRNTLLYRIQRINEIAETDFDDYNERLRLQLSFLVDRR